MRTQQRSAAAREQQRGCHHACPPLLLCQLRHALDVGHRSFLIGVRRRDSSRDTFLLETHHSSSSSGRHTESHTWAIRCYACEIANVQVQMGKEKILVVPTLFYSSVVRHQPVPPPCWPLRTGANSAIVIGRSVTSDRATGFGITAAANAGLRFRACHRFASPGRACRPGPIMIYGRAARGGASLGASPVTAFPSVSPGPRAASIRLSGSL